MLEQSWPNFVPWPPWLNLVTLSTWPKLIQFRHLTLMTKVDQISSPDTHDQSWTNFATWYPWLKLEKFCHLIPMTKVDQISPPGTHYQSWPNFVTWYPWPKLTKFRHLTPWPKLAKNKCFLWRKSLLLILKNRFKILIYNKYFPKNTEFLQNGRKHRPDHLFYNMRPFGLHAKVWI